MMRLREVFDVPLFVVGDRVDTAPHKGYRFPGTVVAVFEKTDGKVRLVVEMDGAGLLHIFSEGDLVGNEDGAPVPG
jgi:hypothetical protein